MYTLLGKKMKVKIWKEETKMTFETAFKKLKEKFVNVDNFEECWKKLVDELNENDFVTIPLISGKGEFRVELNEYGTGLANRTYENDDYQKGKWIAKIVFQQKQYHLGKYDTIEEAAEARHQAEEVLFDGVAAHYERWKERAEADPEWASENPIIVTVSKKSVSELDVVFMPVI